MIIPLMGRIQTVEIPRCFGTEERKQFCVFPYYGRFPPIKVDWYPEEGSVEGPSWRARLGAVPVQVCDGDIRKVIWLNEASTWASLAIPFSHQKNLYLYRHEMPQRIARWLISDKVRRLASFYSGQYSFSELQAIARALQQALEIIQTEDSSHIGEESLCEEPVRVRLIYDRERFFFVMGQLAFDLLTECPLYLCPAKYFPRLFSTEQESLRRYIQTHMEGWVAIHKAGPIGAYLSSHATGLPRTLVVQSAMQIYLLWNKRRYSDAALDDRSVLKFGMDLYTGKKVCTMAFPKENHLKVRGAIIMHHLRGEPHIAQLLSLKGYKSPKRDEEKVRMVMEYYPLGDLQMKLETLSEEQIIQVLGDVLQALKGLHDKGITHRDLKLENIFLAEEKRGEETLVRAYIGDFEFADAPGYRASFPPALGTPAYHSPAYAKAVISKASKALKKAAGPSADMWAFGMVAHLVLHRALYPPEVPFFWMNPHLPPEELRTVIAKIGGITFPYRNEHTDLVEQLLNPPEPLCVDEVIKLYEMHFGRKLT